MYTLFSKLPVLIVGVFLFIACVTLYIRSKNVNRTEFLKIFKTAKYVNLWVIIISILLTVVFTVFYHLKLKQSVHAVFSLNYSEASQAQNSNGTRYNMAEIICDEVVERAIKKGALENVSVSELKSCLVAYPCVQGGVVNESEYHISTEFAVEYHASKETAHLDSENVIKLISAAYKEYYIEKYTDNFKIDTEKEKPDFSKMEYMDIVLYLNKETTSVMNYLYGMAEKNSSFKTSNNSTFNSIAGKVYQFKKTQIDGNLHSLILQNGIARDKSGYVSRLLYQNKNTDFNRQKNAVSFNLCNQAVDMYAEEMTRIVLVPTWDVSGKYYMGRTKVGIDELSVMATNFSNNVASNQKEIMSNELIIDKINANSSNNYAKASADELIDTIYKTIKAFEKEAILAGREYSNHKMNQCIAVSIYGISIMSVLKALIAFAVFSYVSFILFGISRKFPKKS